ncbi:pecanex-like protein 4 isoform X1 [Varroa destructor]|uniref:Pecanex-like protein n=1 Tax=Varroa destructor TaxID=109461 RepID=A0A7M7M5H8_VARDE|nr:pecanex-like protein 4 isoform X1 [Varroa destructor]
MGNPLVSSYKGAFVATRIFSTVTGGIRWPSDTLRGCPRLSYWLLESGLFFFPFIVGGLLLDSLVRNYYLDFYSACGIFAALSFVLVIVLWVVCEVRRGHIVAPEYTDDDMVHSKDKWPCAYRPFPCAFLYAITAACLEASVLYLNFWLSHRKVIKYWTVEMLIRHLLWLADCVTFHSLAVEAPVETASFQPPIGAFHETWYQPLMRPFYLGCLVGGAVFLREVPVEGMNHMLVPFLDTFICLLPLLWLLGVLAPLDALKLWAGEWISTTLFGGSPTPSELSLFTKLLASLTVTAVCYYLQSYKALFACVSGFVLALHYAHLQRWWVAIQHTVIAVLSAIATIKEDAVSSEAELSLGIILAVILVISEILSSLQRVTFLGGLFLNPLWNNFRETRKTSINGIVHILIQGLLVHSVSPILMCWFFSGGNLYPEDALQRVLVTISLVKSYREIFQRTRTSILVSVCTIVFRACSGDLRVLPACVLFVTLSITWRTLMGFLERLYTVGVILSSSIVITKQRLQHNWILFALNITLFPWLLLVSASTAFLESPLLALFSLPIFLPGFPRPRRFWPFRDLMDQQNITRSETQDAAITIKGDIVFYAQFIPRLIEKLESPISRGLFGSLQAGSCILARHQNRLVLLRVIEAGYLFRCVEAKGLELQETSCHSLEAATVDQIIDECFLKVQVGCGNPYAMNSFRPRARTHVVTYSSARNVLNGVIDQPAFNEAMLNNFSRVLLWILLHQQARSIRENNNYSDADIAGSTDMLSEHSRYRPRKSWWLLMSQETSSFRRYPSRLFVDSWMTLVAIHIRRSFPDIVMAVAEEPSLCVDYRQVCDFCYRAVFPDGPLSPSIIHQAFNGKYAKELPLDLHELVRQAVQYTTKLAVDTVIIGEAETETELARILRDYDARWFIGIEGSAQWNKCVTDEIPYMFSIAHDASDDVYTSHLLSLILDEPVYVGTLSGPTVDAIWATLSLELLYITNDDDERYSIQAHPWLLRNLAIQAADPPLGYPVYIDRVRYLTAFN